MRRSVEIPISRAFVPFLKPSRYKGAYGGRGSGKSQGFVDLLIDNCLQRKVRALCLREHQVSLQQSVKSLIESKIRKYGLQNKFNIKDKVIETPGRDGGGLIVFQGMKNHTADSIKSYEDFNIALFEEAQRCSARSLKLLRPTIRAEGSELWFPWNPENRSDPIDQLLRSKTPPPRSIVLPIGWQDNPWFPDELEEERTYDKKRDIDRYNHVWEGGYDDKSNARVFKRWRIGELDEFEGIEDRLLPRYGCDFGYSQDPSTCVEMYVDTKKKIIYITKEAHRIGVEIDHLPTFYLKAVPGVSQWPVVCDSARPDTISYLRRHGIPRAESAKKGKNSIYEGVEFLKSFDIIVHPDCIHVIDELTHYKYKLDPDTDEVTPILADEKNHIIDACRYALEKLRKKLRVGIF